MCLPVYICFCYCISVRVAKREIIKTAKARLKQISKNPYTFIHSKRFFVNVCLIIVVQNNCLFVFKRLYIYHVVIHLLSQWYTTSCVIIKMKDELKH